jgi:ankyrin repeat protein
LRWEALTVTRQDGWTPLHVASEEGHLEVAGALLAKGANMEAKNNVRTS